MGKEKEAPSNFKPSMGFNNYDSKDNALIELYKIMLKDESLSKYIVNNLESSDIDNSELREIFLFVEDLLAKNQSIDQEAVLEYLSDNYILDDELRLVLESGTSDLRDYDIYKYIDELINKVKSLDKKNERINILKKIKELEKLESTPENIEQIENLLNKLIEYNNR